MKILRTTDVVEFVHDGVSIGVSPMKQHQKMEILRMVKIQGGEATADVMQQAISTIRFCVKKLSGVTGYDDRPYELSFDGDMLTEDCAGEVVTVLQSTPLLGAVGGFVVSGVFPDGIEAWVNGKKLGNS